MAALALTAGVALALDARSTSAPARAGEGAPAAVVNKVTLELRITGLGKKGCEVEVKPGHAACEFDKVTKKVEYYNTDLSVLTLSGMSVKSTSPDRDCQFEITVKEPDQAPRVVRRGIRLIPPAAGATMPEQTFKCYLRSPSLAARDEAQRRLR